MKVAVLDDWEATAGWLTEDERLSPWASFHVFSDHLADPDALVDRLSQFDAVVVMRERTPFPESVLRRLPGLQLLVTSGMTNASVDIDAADAHGVVVCGAPGAGDGTAELTWALLLALAREVPRGDRLVRDGAWLSAGVGVALEGRTLGVVGFGRIGRRVAGIGRAFGMEVVAWSPTLTSARATSGGARIEALHRLPAISDFVTVHVPLSDRSRGMIDASFLSRMKPTAFLVNTARAELVDGRALEEALRAGGIAGAAADVFADEPARLDDPLVQARANTVLSPHRGYVVDTTMRAYRRSQASALRAYHDGSAINVLSRSPSRS